MVEKGERKARIDPVFDRTNCCGKYPVGGGIWGWNCPECGNDVTKAGRVKPDQLTLAESLLLKMGTQTTKSKGR